MFKFIFRSIIILLSNTTLLYLTSHYLSDNIGFSLDIIEGFKFFPWDSYNFVGILFLGFVFWFFNSIISRIIKLLILPIRILTLGLSNIFVNVGLLYLIQYVINYHINIGFNITLGTLGQTFILSIILAVSTAVLHFIIKKLL